MSGGRIAQCTCGRLVIHGQTCICGDNLNRPDGVFERRKKLLDALYGAYPDYVLYRCDIADPVDAAMDWYDIVELLSPVVEGMLAGETGGDDD